MPNEPAESSSAGLKLAAEGQGVEDLSGDLEGMQIIGLRGNTGLQPGVGKRVEDLMRDGADGEEFSGGDDTSSDDDEAGNGLGSDPKGGVGQTRRAGVRSPLSDGDDDEGRSPFEDPVEGEGDSSEEELVDIRPRRIS